MADDRIVVFVHGWSVRNTDTYGGLPAALKREASRAAELRIDVRHIWLGKYISFRDEVRVEDLARALQNALNQELGDELRAGRRFVCITHSTGGPVVRDRWNRFYIEPANAGACPMSHLIMLAPANFGSALAQLGKERIGRLKSWFEGVEPGAGVLDWLELGSSEAWDLNTKWIASRSPVERTPPVFPFVLTGQSIDRKLYDHLNTYTDEAGSDGVVRTAAANLNAGHVRLVQELPPPNLRGRSTLPRVELQMDGPLRRSPRTAFALIEGRAHSGKDKGIMGSVAANDPDHPTVATILRCLVVATPQEYFTLCDAFDTQNRAVREKERIEPAPRRLLLPDTPPFFHDTHSMVVARVRDDRGYVVNDFELTLLGGPEGRASADRLPRGFLVDRQKNRRDGGAITFYFCYDAMNGLQALTDARDRTIVVRRELPGVEALGFALGPRPDTGFVHYFPAFLAASRQVLSQFLRPDETNLIDVVLKRVVREGAFRLTRRLAEEDFTDEPPGAVIG